MDERVQSVMCVSSPVQSTSYCSDCKLGRRERDTFGGGGGMVGEGEGEGGRRGVRRRWRGRGRGRGGGRERGRKGE